MPSSLIFSLRTSYEHVQVRLRRRNLLIAACVFFLVFRCCTFPEDKVCTPGPTVYLIKSFSAVLWFKLPTKNLVSWMLWFRLFRCFVVFFSHDKDSPSEDLSSVWCCYCCCCFRLCDSWVGCVFFVVFLFTWEALLEQWLLLWFWFAINSKAVICISISVLIIWFFSSSSYWKKFRLSFRKLTLLSWSLKSFSEVTKESDMDSAFLFILAISHFKCPFTAASSASALFICLSSFLKHSFH